MVAGAGRRPGKLFAIVAAASAAIVVVGVLASPGDVALLRRDGALASRSMSALLTIFPTNAVGCGLAERLL
jgi:hypothetical protein